MEGGEKTVLNAGFMLLIYLSVLFHFSSVKIKLTLEK